MSELADFHALFTRLQSRYPTSTLVSELVATQAEAFVVRALVQVGGTTLATAMASATTVETAEDQARLRVLSLLGISVTGAAPSNLLPINFEVPARSASLDTSLSDSNVGLAASGLAPSKNEASTYNPLPSPTLEDIPQTPIAPLGFNPQPLADSVFDSSFSFEVSSEDDLADQEPIATFDNFSVDENLPEADLPPFEPMPAVAQEASDEAPAVTTKPRKTKKPAPTNEPLDLSSLIALTDVEMERTGLSKKRGQAYLVETFGKQTRADLDENQLLDFLNYLRALPSRYQSSGEE